MLRIEVNRQAGPLARASKAPWASLPSNHPRPPGLASDMDCFAWPPASAASLDRLRQRRVRVTGGGATSLRGGAVLHGERQLGDHGAGISADDCGAPRMRVGPWHRPGSSRIPRCPPVAPRTPVCGEREFSHCVCDTCRLQILPRICRPRPTSGWGIDHRGNRNRSRCAAFWPAMISATRAGLRPRPCVRASDPATHVRPIA